MHESTGGRDKNLGTTIGIATDPLLAALQRRSWDEFLHLNPSDCCKRNLRTVSVRPSA
jgi:hypothetical protein